MLSIYRCYVQHQLKVLDHNGTEVPGIFTAGVQVQLDPHSIHMIEQSEEVLNQVFHDNVTLFVKVQASSSLRYQWYYNDKILAGQCTAQLELIKLTFDQAGHYKCFIVNESGDQIASKSIQVLVDLPTGDEFDALEFENETIEILEQPVWRGHGKVHIGDQVHLSCRAACKYPLKYEWLKKSVRTNVENKNTEQNGPILVSLECKLTDEVPDITPHASYHIYQCIITCVQTGEKVHSDEVKVPVSTYTLPDKSLPVFKIALLICQEQYTNEGFENLEAPRPDGKQTVFWREI